MNTTRLITNSKRLLGLQCRAFGPKGKGGPMDSAPYVPPKVIPTNFEVMIEEKGID
jgi:hypothetical protein